MDGGDMLLYGLYTVTVALGIALAIWMFWTRRAKDELHRKLRQSQTSAEESPRVRAVRGIASTNSMAQALAGIRLPVHWQPDPPTEVRSPFTITSNKETPGEMADALTTELARIGYRITPTGASSARAVRNDGSLTIEAEAEADAEDDGAFVSFRISLFEARRG